MPRGVKAAPTAKAVAMLERELDRIGKRMAKYEQLRRDHETVRKAIAAIKGLPFQGVDQGGVHHVVTSSRKAS